MVASSIDLLIHLVRLPSGRRLVAEISQLEGFAQDHFQLKPLYLADQGEMEESAGKIKQDPEGPDKKTRRPPVFFPAIAREEALKGQSNEAL